jgi:superfamily II DNA or RNA helicase
MASKDNTAASRTQRFERYQNLPESDQRVLELLSLIYHPISRSALADCANAANIPNAMGKRWTTALLKLPVTEWEAIGLVNQSSAGVQCDPLVVELITRELAKSDRFAAYAQVTRTKARSTSSALDAVDIVIRFSRIGLYLNEPKQVEEALSRYGYGAVELQDVLRTICFNPFDRDWFLSLDPDLIMLVLEFELCSAALDLEPQPELLETLAMIANDRRYPSHCSEMLALLCEQYLLQGRIQEAREVIQALATMSEPAGYVYRGWIALLEGDSSSSLHQYDKAIDLTLQKQAQSKRKPLPCFVPGFEGLFFTFALIRDGSPERLQQALQQAKLGATRCELFAYGYSNLVLAISAQLGNLKARSLLLEMPVFTYQNQNSFDTLMSLMARYWVDRDAATPLALRLLRPIYTDAIEAGYDWIALEAVSLLAELHEDEMFAQLAATMREMGEFPEMTLCFQAMQPKSAWELQLLALKALKVNPAAAETSKKAQRMAWAIHLETWGEVTIEPREQKQNAKGGWSRGRAVALRRLVKELDSFSYLSDRDRQICQQIEVTRDYGSYYGSGTTYSIPSRVILDLAGHPAVVWRDSPTVGVEIVAGQPQLVVRHNADETLTIALVPHFSGEQEWVIEQESMTRLKVIGIQEKHRQVAAIFGGASEIRVPAYAQDQVLAAIEAVAGNMLVQSDIGGVSNIETVPSDPTPHVHLLPASSGLKVLLLSRPFRSGGPYYRPGQGGTTAITEIEGLQVQTTRELDDEVTQAQATIAACPTLRRLGGYDDSADEYEWLVSEPIDCLELLTELQALQPADQEADGEVVNETAIATTVCPIIEWPEGEKFRVSRYLNPTDMKISIGRQRDWFAAEGELRVDENTVFDLQQLLRLLEMSPGRFVQLGNGQFAALTKEFRKQLEDLRNFGEEHGDGIRFHPLASLAIEDTLSELGELNADKSWKEHVRRIREMRAVRPELPSTLQAELRDYQIEGFQWLMQLAHWGVGACLADDMGLGKTLQSLGVILSRASAGPTLVVAPTSVGMNWLSEASKFAPTLNPIWLGSGDRQQTIEQLQARDLVVCSYGLLQQGDVGELLAGVEWTTVILDEAQAIKNAATQRSKAAMKLQADFRLILTGTPIENHLGELWNLFQFINPGLLGSQAKFQQRFITPIERHQDVNVRRQLRTLIQPFILRRTKTQVLSELPSRTEITLPVELSPEEMALYEATRRNALVKLSESDDDQAGARHLRVLAEILRLRRLCCNPRLVVPDTPIPSSKLTVFGEVLEELLENRHKALVFSQFVDHLAIVRDYLEQHQISYQYLDGSTPAKTRKQRVDAFQSGEGDVFLISLKAGGTGLNLTAADYVIHLDPWWNPAVEDQASDRAHRIGQQRPVTIYRLVSCGTIEEKIVDLHQQKRDLADSLLEGTDVSGKLSADQLLAMISSEGS